MRVRPCDAVGVSAVRVTDTDVLPVTSIDVDGLSVNDGDMDDVVEGVVDGADSDTLARVCEMSTVRESDLDGPDTVADQD